MDPASFAPAAIIGPRTTADTGIRAALHVLAALGERDLPLSKLGFFGSSGLASWFGKGAEDVRGDHLDAHALVLGATRSPPRSRCAPP
jgi:hypothetical protein